MPSSLQQASKMESTSQPGALQRVPVVKRFEKTNGVRQSTTSHQYVHDLVARAVNVKGSRKPLFRNAGSVNHSPRPIHEAKAQKVRNGHSSVLHFPAVEEDAVDDGDEGRETEERKHDGAHDAVCGSAEFGLHCQDRAAERGRCCLSSVLLISRDNAGLGERRGCNYDRVVEVEELRRTIEAEVVAGDH